MTILPVASREGRTTLRAALLQRRSMFWAGPEAASAQSAVQATLRELLLQLDPTVLGLFWPIRGEFSPGVKPYDPLWPNGVPVALPFAQKLTAPGAGSMVYRMWNGAEPTERDPCGIPTASGGRVAPDVLLVPCVGYTPSGYRLGYGGGYFDSYLAANPGLTTIGVAWSGTEIDSAQWAAEPHDERLTLVVTERGVLAPP